jgi:hypothetical protein
MINYTRLGGLIYDNNFRLPATNTIVYNKTDKVFIKTVLRMQSAMIPDTVMSQLGHGREEDKKKPREQESEQAKK